MAPPTTSATTACVGFIALNSPTLRDALANVERYISVTNEGTDVVLELAGPVSALRFRDADPALRPLRQNSERVSALFVKGARELTQAKATPVRVEFIHERPNARIDYEGILGCPVRFRAEWDAVIFSEETLRLPVIGADNRLLRTLEAACRRSSAADRERTTSSIQCANTSCKDWQRGRRRSTTWPATST